MNAQFFKTLNLVIALLVGFSLSGQAITLTLPGTGGIGPCIETNAGTSINFTRDASCIGNVVIVPGDGSLFTVDDEVLRTTSTDFAFSFASAGEFSVLCDAPGSIATVVACFNVAPSTAIPTLGEWGLIMLLLVSLIIGVVTLRQTQKGKTLA